MQAADAQLGLGDDLFDSGFLGGTGEDLLGVGGNEDDLDVRALRLQAPGGLQAVDARQPVVQQHELGRNRLEVLESLFT